MNILVQVLYSLSFSEFSESFTSDMYCLTRNCMTRLLVDDDSRLLSLLLFDCKSVIEVIHLVIYFMSRTCSNSTRRSLQMKPFRKPICTRFVAWRDTSGIRTAR